MSRDPDLATVNRTLSVTLQKEMQENARLRAEKQSAALDYLGQIGQLSDEVTRLRAALREIIADSFSVYAIQVARSALETPTASAAENTDDR